MKTIFKKLMPAIFIAILSISLMGCGAKPDETAKNFLEAIKQQDIQKAASLVKDNSSKKELKFDNKEQEKIVKAIFSKVDYSLGEVEKKGDTATVKASITSIDLPKITGKMITELLPTMMSQAFSEGKVDEKKQETMVLEHMLKSINDAKAAKTKTDVTIKLVKNDKGWLIEPNEELINALTGNFYSATKQLQGK
ncbi:uncharacterized lipoprotein YehR (DUF1307 family) [Clostridium tetanomorphum]|uniref:DUF4878 domain-containing protein n=1 Tax=Clostridium tetanomorphum TaxID=1553 RepID=A0A923J032_CLOTT|nr:DUF4878 domain-containing protein [Clostridium tetanomorphum]KAJ49580.1 hypothetical protein CTM_22339 [Clostridium tetanomorphum DSM 665]KAJ51749.1 hypothetical protein CTM_10793 [Clostridium tetanomorphum DSM 665]MBC2397632.1 DUF4878 domain-containing protein [Clostridium tetanomorphum]MBP1864984.1 uncharacterized lipoprotein YehR (DUF1307 family) [Clostridium tetanomorphum]NRS83419.1 uncharacterized lipoprotein YehR (DUF1307 family) [Clostridium tetanomorphum]